MNKSIIVVSLIISFVFLLFSSLETDANDLQGPAILDVTYFTSDEHETVQYDIATLEMFGMQTTVTDTPWTEGATAFTGVLLRNVLQDLGLETGVVRAIALNDYAVEIPFEDFIENDVILALKRDEKYLTVRDKGPLWVIYPWAEHPRLRTEVYYSRSIWQLRKLEVRAN